MKRLSSLGVLALLGVLGLMTTALADQSIAWVSVSPTGSGGNGLSAMSDDGRYVAFASTSTDLVPDDTNGALDVFVKDMATGAVERVSVASDGTQGDVNARSGSITLDMSNDGRLVLFNSDASNLVPDDTNSRGDLFVKDRQTGEVTRIVRDDGTEGEVANIGSLSGNGRFVAFAGNGFDDQGDGVFVMDLQSGGVERITDGITAFTPFHDVKVSNDGRYLAILHSDFETNREIVLFDRNTDTYELASPRIGGESPQSRMSHVAISGDGRYVAFGSPDTNYVTKSDDSVNDVYVYDSQTGQLERIATGGASQHQDPMPVLSDDGRVLVFTAGTMDLYGADNGRWDVVVYDRHRDTGEVVSVHPDGSPGERHSGVAGTGVPAEAALSGDGRFVVFSTEVAFDPADSGNRDFYMVDREGTSTGPPTGGECTHDFGDVDSSNVFEDDICWLAARGITRGCNPPVNTEFCPKDPVTRGQMAAFLVRALGYGDDGGGDLFDDDDGSVFEGDIDRLGTAGVTRGCNPPANTLFCPDDDVTRGQMAAFLVRALGYTDTGGGDLFDDDDGSVFEGDIDRLGTAGVTRGCNPPANTLFCPDDDVTREQMAAFLRRALGG